MTLPRDLIDIYLDDQLDEQQAELLRDWLRADREHMREFLRRTSLHHALRSELQAAGACDRFLEEESIPGAPARPRSVRRHAIRPLSRAWQWRALGAALAAGLLLAIGLPQLIARHRDDGAIIAAGQAQVEREGALVTLHAGQALRDGDAITAERSASVTLHFQDGTDIVVEAGAQLTLITHGGSAGAAGSSGTSGSGKRLRLGSGRITAEVAKQPADRPLIITTSVAQATVVGTAFTLASVGGRTRLDVVHGLVRLNRTTGGDALVGAGEYAEAAADLAPVARKRDPSEIHGVPLTVGGPQHNQLLGPDGRRFVMKGAAVTLSPASPRGDAPPAAGPDAAALACTRAFTERGGQLDAMRAMGINTVRIAIGGAVAADARNGYRTAAEGYGGFAGYVQRLVAYAASARTRGMQVIFCYGGDDAWSNDEHWPLYQRLLGAVIAGLPEDGGVSFELIDGPEIADQDWVRCCTRSIAFIRSRGYHGPLIVDLNHYGNWWFAPMVDEVARTDQQLVFSLHYAKWVGWEHTAQLLAHGADHAVILGSIVRDVNGDVGEAEALAAAGAVAELVMRGLAVGAIATGWNRIEADAHPHPHGNRMTEDEGALRLGPWGTGFRDRFSGILPDWLDVPPAR
jgi:hypothetical protein